VKTVFEELEKTISGKPLCSIVIPVHNRVDLTRQCLDAVRQNTSEVSYEVVVVDDGSTDGTAEFLAGLEPPFRSIANDGNLGFARSCNAGAWAADGQYILFLNNDTVPLPGWLPPMIRCMQERPEVGIVGSKLLYPEDDLIQHAGVAISPEKAAYHIYRCLPADLPEVNRERECQAVTGACFLVRTSLFKELRGFDDVFRNGLEDIDFCLRAREHGYKVWYCPLSVLYHHESMSPGRLHGQEHNIAAFFKRWAGKITPDPVSAKHVLARAGSPLLKVNTRGDKFVMFRGRTLYICDHRRWKTRKYSNVFSYGLARLYYGVRYCKYRSRIRELRREAVDEEHSGLSTVYPAGRDLQMDLPSEGEHLRERNDNVKPDSQSAARTVLVLGMHRSGTSMLARLVNLCGAYIAEPFEIMAPSPDNPAGYWEPKQLVEINRTILSQMDCSWCSLPAQMLPGSLENVDATVVSDMKRFLSCDVPQDRSRVLKDPRMSALLPLWRELLARPVALIVWRNPVDVAKSLEARDRFPASVSYALWEQYTRSAIEASEGMPRMLVSFDRFIREPKSSIETLVEFLAEHAGTKAEDVQFERLLSVASLDIVHHRSPEAAFFEDRNSSGSQRELLRRLEASGTRPESVKLDFDVEPVSVCRDELYRSARRIDDMARQLDGMGSELQRLLRLTHSLDRGARKYRVSHWFLHRVGLTRFARWTYKRWGPEEAEPSGPPKQTGQ
jgi:GT2 family glycosyltransferase